MDGVGADLDREVDQCLRFEIALARRGRSDTVGLVRRQDRERLAIGVGIDDGAADPLLAQRAQDADGDLATVGNQDFAKRNQSDLALSPALWTVERTRRLRSLQCREW